VAAQLLGAQAILEGSATESFDAKVAYETICRVRGGGRGWRGEVLVAT